MIDDLLEALGLKTSGGIGGLGGMQTPNVYSGGFGAGEDGAFIDPTAPAPPPQTGGLMQDMGIDMPSAPGEIDIWDVLTGGSGGDVNIQSGAGTDMSQYSSIAKLLAMANQMQRNERRQIAPVDFRQFMAPGVGGG